jgi:hypothetical protein
VLRTPDQFRDKRVAAEQAAEITEHRRREIHVRSLRLYLGALRILTFKTVSDGEIAGATLIDRFWRGLINWATVEQPRLAALQQYELIKARILAAPNDERRLHEFDALGGMVTAAAAAG